MRKIKEASLILMILVIFLLFSCNLRTEDTKKTREIVLVNQTVTKKMENNTIEKNKSIQKELIGDVAVSNLSLKSTTYAVNYPIKIMIDIKNGEIPLSDVIVEVYDNNELLKRYDISLDSLEKKNIELEWIPVYGGIHNIRVVVDPNNSIKEISETNNELNLDIKIEE